MYEAAVIGTGDPTSEADATGCAMGYSHGEGYRNHDDCELVAGADLVEENRRRFADRFDVDDARTYERHTDLLREEDVDVVSVCTHPATHADIVVECLEADSVRAVHCEKPMGYTLEDCREMVASAERHGVQLTINHQRRFAEPVTETKRMLDAGTIGDLERVELSAWTLYDYATHLLDLCGHFTGEARAEWVLAQIDYRDENIVFGAHNENQSIVRWKYDNGVDGLAVTGTDVSMFDPLVRLVGTDGVVELGRPEIDPPEMPILRYRNAATGGWTEVDCREDCHGFDETSDRPGYIDRAIADCIDSLAEGRPSPLDARNSLRATEIVFAAWESARRRGRIDLPAEIDGNPLEEMVESGQLSPSPTDG